MKISIKARFCCWNEDKKREVIVILIISGMESSIISDDASQRGAWQSSVSLLLGADRVLSGCLLL